MELEEYQLLHERWGVHFRDCREQAKQDGWSVKLVVRSGVTRMGFLSLWSKNTAAELLSEASVVIPSINEMIKKTQEFEE